MFAAPTPAQAGRFLGQNSYGVAYCAEDTVHAQESIEGGLSYVASAPGVITFWSIPPTPEPGHTLQLVILRRNYPPSGVGHYFTALAKDIVRPLSSTTYNYFRGMRVPIEAGQELGLYVPAGQPDVTVGMVTAPAGVCMFGAGFGMAAMNRYRTHAGDPPIGTELDYTTAGSPYRLNVQVFVEPDADRDGFGDESQDDCPTNASTQGFCPRATAPAPRTLTRTRRKCKRRKAKPRSAAVAKKKSCKRRKKK